ncbi:MAG: endonuclease/exonuclease/phosphatase family protein [Candidatus Saccharicenans sp.]|uniref:endonuclease/exonuclease/phosphatase family protein n=1 Tax=Candidatus Saccharicenans sp. TaxID=2819258 RepID=UPI00404B7226
MIIGRGHRPSSQKFSDAIPAIITFLSILFILLLYPACSPDSTADLELKVMTYNVRFDNPADGPHNWQYRREAAASLIRSQSIDLVGTQEVLKNQLDDFLQRLPNYSSIGVGREDGRTAGEFSAILYLKDRFQVVESGNFWLSPIPEIPGSRGWDAACERIVTWGIFEEKASGWRLAFFNTHLDHVGEVARRESARLLLQRIQNLAAALPVILGGDFNAPPETEPIRIILESGFLEDARLQAASISGPGWSFHGFGRLPEEQRPLIDFIFTSRQFEVLEYRNIFERVGETYYSDHNPVLVRLKLRASGQ